MEFEARQPEELQEIARSFLALYPQPGVFILDGEMGAGKTTFIRAICAQLGIDEASSPTFSLVNEYHTPAGFKVFHFDLYRIRSLEEALDFGFEEYLDQGAYVFVEWSEKILPLLDSYHTIRIQVNETGRSIQF